ncbi:MAG: hypothetical protein WCP97_05630 [bacterium]
MTNAKTNLLKLVTALFLFAVTVVNYPGIGQLYTLYRNINTSEKVGCTYTNNVSNCFVIKA